MFKCRYNSVAIILTKKIIQEVIYVKGSLIKFKIACTHTYTNTYPKPFNGFVSFLIF